MWCGKCQADVAAEVSPDNQRVFCTACGALLSTIDAPPPRPASERFAADKTKDARELLQRWSTGKVLDPFGPPMQMREFAESNAPPSLPTNVAHDAMPVAPQIPLVASRVIDVSASIALRGSEEEGAESPAINDSTAIVVPAERPLSASPVAVPVSVPVVAQSPIVLPPPSPLDHPETAAPTIPNILVTPTPSLRVDAVHPAEHFIGTAAATPRNQTAAGPFVNKTVEPEPPRETNRSLLRFPGWEAAVWRSEPSAPGSWSFSAGQFLAYLGVLGLTAGACLVVWSYFGGPANYAPTGWLIATAGQMLLFFGVVTLVSGGLEQTTEQVNQRIEQLGDHIIRIEQAAREMNARGTVPPAHFGEHTDAVFSSVHERAVVEK